MRSLTVFLLLCTTVSAAPPATELTIPPEEKALLDKWIVRSVQIDGKPTPAQIGQKKGDIIEIKRKEHRFFLS